jgi:hypothetical protein
VKRVLCSAILIVLLITTLTSCGLDVPRPEVKSGEFDFTVTYEFNGETKTVSGVYVCEYAGLSWSLDGGFHRDWDSYVEGVDEVVEIGTSPDGGKVELIFAFYPEYFMGEDVSYDLNIPQPYISVTIIDDEGMTILHLPDEVEAHCGARIISYEYDAPIENKFSIFNF